MGQITAHFIGEKGLCCAQADSWGGAEILLVAFLTFSTQRCSAVPPSLPAPAPVPGEMQQLLWAAHPCTAAPAPGLHLRQLMCHRPALPQFCQAESKRSNNNWHPLSIFFSDSVSTTTSKLR